MTQDIPQACVPAQAIITLAWSLCGSDVLTSDQSVLVNGFLPYRNTETGKSLRYITLRATVLFRG